MNRKTYTLNDILVAIRCRDISQCFLVVVVAIVAFFVVADVVVVTLVVAVIIFFPVSWACPQRSQPFSVEKRLPSGKRRRCGRAVHAFTLTGLLYEEIKRIFS